MANKRQQYTEEDRATALAFLDACAGNLERAAKHTGIPRNTIRYWRDGGGLTEPVSELRQQKRSDFKKRWQDEADAALTAAAKIRYEASYRDLITAAAVATDKIIALENACAHSAEEILSEVTDIVLALVNDPDARQKIADEFERLAESLGSQNPGRT